MLSTHNLKFMELIEYPDIEIRKGKTTFICGESGSGKSTLLKLFNGVLSPSRGTVHYMGRQASEYDTLKLRQEILLANQSIFLFDDSISSNYDEYYNYRELPHLSKEEKEKFLNICCLDMALDAACRTMSGGERQRVFTAICLSLKPKILMLDEPTAALDDINAEKLISNVKSYCADNDMTLLIVCHNKAIAEKLADDMVILERKSL